MLRNSAPAGTARVREALARELRDAGAVPPPIEVEVVPEIERDPGHGAKFKLVKSTAPLRPSNRARLSPSNPRMGPRPGG